MNTNRKLIIAFIVIVIVVLGGVIALAPHPSNETPVTPNLTLAKHNFGYFEMDVPTGSNFQVKSNQIEVGKGKVLWQNKGNFSNETDAVAISKGYTDSLIPQDMQLLSEDNGMKVYVTPNTVNKLYKVVRSMDDVDIIVSGYNLTLIEKMANSTVLKDTSKLVLQKPVNNTTNVNNTTTKPVVKTTVDTSKATNKTTAGNVETTAEKVKNITSNVQTKVDNATNQAAAGDVEKTSEKAKQTSTNPNVETTTDNAKNTTSEQNPNKGDDISIGGGSFAAGNALENKVYAKLYLGSEHAGETVKVKITYSSEGANLNNGNPVETTIKNDGYVSIASADAYSEYPDHATVEVYDPSGKLLSSRELNLNLTEGTQYF